MISKYVGAISNDKRMNLKPIVLLWNFDSRFLLGDENFYSEDKIGDDFIKSVLFFGVDSIKKLYQVKKKKNNKLPFCL